MSSLAPTRPKAPLAWLLNRLQLGRHKGMLLAGALLVASASPIYLLQTGGALSTGYTIQQLQRDRAQWILKNEQLEAEIARGRSLAWVEAEAVNRLGMQRPAQQTIIKVDVSPPSIRSERSLVNARVRPDSGGPSGAAQNDPSIGGSWSDALGGVLASLLAGR